MENQPIETDRREATEEEIKSLPHVVDSVPLIVWIALVIGASERLVFYSVTAPWQNYIQNSPNDKDVSGALGLGQSTATNINNAFYLFFSLTPVPIAIVSDMWLGRHKTTLICFFLDLCGCLVLFITSLPCITQTSAKIAGLTLAMLFLGIGTGGLKATMSPFIADQYTTMTPQLVVRKNGEKVIADRALTLQYIYNVFYWFTSIATLFLIAAVYLEKTRGFWAAFLLPTCSFCVSIPLLILWSRSFVKPAPQGNVLPQAGKVIAYSARHRFRLDAAQPSFQAEKYGRRVPWNDEFVSEMKRCLKACQVMLAFIPFYVGISQMSNNLVSQAGQMRRGDIPNDMFIAFTGIACVILGPLIQKVLYPVLNERGIPFTPIIRMAFSFVAMGAAMAYAAGVQKLIYLSGPCYDRPLACPASNSGNTPNDISVWVQVPVYFFLGIAEILGYTSLYEYSYSEAPKDMRSMVQAIRQVTSGLGSVLAMSLSPVSEDPKVLWLYTGLAVSLIGLAPVFWYVLRGHEKPAKEQQ